jgi:hypothetical protein
LTRDDGRDWRVIAGRARGCQSPAATPVHLAKWFVVHPGRHRGEVHAHTKPEAPERLKSLIRLYADRINAEGMAVELSIRQWARTSPEAAAIVARVDDARLRNVEKLYAELGAAPQAAKARAFLFYSFVFGQSLLFLDVDERRKRALITAAANALTADRD